MSEFDHVLGSKGEEITFLPSLDEPAGISKEARRDFNSFEKQSLIDEDGQASNRVKIDVKGTHYETSSTSEIAQMIMPLKGL